MKMIWVLIVALFSSVVQDVYAQETVKPDSLIVYPTGTDKNLISTELPLLNDKTLSFPEFSVNKNTLFNLPLIPDHATAFDFRKNFRTEELNFSQNSATGMLFSPFVQGRVFNSASYRITDRFSFGGNSFGAQTIFEPPAMNQSIQEMNIKGASMFMQYKVSDNFKVETRFSISTRSSGFEP